MKTFKQIRGSISEAKMIHVNSHHTKDGKIVVIHHGNDFTAVLHQHHIDAIKKLPVDAGVHEFKDEQGVHWQASKGKNFVHLQDLHSKSHSVAFPRHHIDEQTVNEDSESGHLKVGDTVKIKPEFHHQYPEHFATKKFTVKNPTSSVRDGKGNVGNHAVVTHDASNSYPGLPNILKSKATVAHLLKHHLVKEEVDGGYLLEDGKLYKDATEWRETAEKRGHTVVDKDNESKMHAIGKDGELKGVFRRNPHMGFKNKHGWLNEEEVIVEVKRKKFLGQFRGKTATGQKANPIDVNPTMKIRKNVKLRK